MDENWGSLINGLPICTRYDAACQDFLDFYYYCNKYCSKLLANKTEFDTVAERIKQGLADKLADYADTDLSGYRGELTVENANKEFSAWIANIFDVMQRKSRYNIKEIA